MSRNTHSLGEHLTIHFGSDPALGNFLDITDRRFANSDLDEQGEGYVMEYSTVFGFSTNLIGAKIEDIKDKDKLKELANKFWSSISTQQVTMWTRPISVTSKRTLDNYLKELISQGFNIDTVIATDYRSGAMDVAYVVSHRVRIVHPTTESPKKLPDQT